MTTEIVKRLNREEAQALTERIRATTETLWELLTKAKEGEAWDTLGYDSWADYVKAEFNMSKQYSYRILHQAMVIHELAEAAGESPMGDSLNIRERQARKITPEALPQAAAEVREAVAQGIPPAEAIDVTVQKFGAAMDAAVVQVIGNDALPDARRVYEAVTRMKQGWDASAIGPSISSIYGAKDVGHVLDELTQSVVYLDDVTRHLREYLERS